MISVLDQIVKRIKNKGSEYVFSAKDFLDLGSRGAVDMALASLLKSGKIRRIQRGLYDYPRFSELLGKMVAPDFAQVANAIARKTGHRIQPSGAIAANLLGLSEQVPAKIVYLTDGRSRRIQIGSQTIVFQQVSPKELLADKKLALVLQALRFLGKEAVTDDVIQKLRSFFSPTEKNDYSRQQNILPPGCLKWCAKSQENNNMDNVAKLPDGLRVAK